MEQHPELLVFPSVQLLQDEGVRWPYVAAFIRLFVYESLYRRLFLRIHGARCPQQGQPQYPFRGSSLLKSFHVFFRFVSDMEYQRKSTYKILNNGTIRLEKSAAYFFSKQASKAWADGWKSICLTNSHDSRAPCSRSIALSSHSTESGP